MILAMTSYLDQAVAKIKAWKKEEFTGATSKPPQKLVLPICQDSYPGVPDDLTFDHLQVKDQQVAKALHEAIQGCCEVDCKLYLGRLYGANMWGLGDWHSVYLLVDQEGKKVHASKSLPVFERDELLADAESLVKGLQVDVSM